MNSDPATGLAEAEAPLSRAQAVARLAANLVAAGVEPDEAREDARALLRAAAGLSRLELATEPEAPLPKEAWARLLSYGRRRAAREPVSRILGGRGFWTLDLAVAPNVLDPRADTEVLVETALGLLETRAAPLAILDLGSGSGAILCALLSELPKARGVAVDLSGDACAATAANLARCGLADRAEVLRGRWGEALEGPFDLVVSNPPYVRAGEIGALDPEVRLHDPALALDGGVDGLDCYREIVGDLRRLLAPDGRVAFEVGWDQAAPVAALLRDAGFSAVLTTQDPGGRDRVVSARLSPQRS